MKGSATDVFPSWLFGPTAAALHHDCPSRITCRMLRIPCIGYDNDVVREVLQEFADLNDVSQIRLQKQESGPGTDVESLGESVRDADNISESIAGLTLSRERAQKLSGHI